MQPPTVSLIVVNYNAAPLTERLVGSLVGEVDEVIVVDNASPAGPPRCPEGVVLLVADANLGYGAGANLGARRASADVLVIANPDVSIDVAALHALAAAAVEPGVGVVAPRFVYPNGALQRSAHRRYPGLMVTLQELSPAFAAVMARLDPEWHATLLRPADHDVPRNVDHVLGALLVVRASAFRAVGGFDERYFLYREETDLCARLRTAGWQVRHLPSASAEHIGQASNADPWPIAARWTALDSHYRFIAGRWGRGRARLAWAVGVVAAVSWVITGPERAAGRHALRWHVGAGRWVLRRDAGGAAA